MLKNCFASRYEYWTYTPFGKLKIESFDKKYSNRKIEVKSSLEPFIPAYKSIYNTLHFYTHLKVLVDNKGNAYENQPRTS